MRNIGRRQYKLTQIKKREVFVKEHAKGDWKEKKVKHKKFKSFVKER